MPTIRGTEGDDALAGAGGAVRAPGLQRGGGDERLERRGRPFGGSGGDAFLTAAGSQDARGEFTGVVRGGDGDDRIGLNADDRATFEGGTGADLATLFHDAACGDLARVSPDGDDDTLAIRMVTGREAGAFTVVQNEVGLTVRRGDGPTTFAVEFQSLDLRTSGELDDSITLLDGAHTVFAGAGDDVVSATALSGGLLVGGTGFDTLVLRADPNPRLGPLDLAEGQAGRAVASGFERFEVRGGALADEVRLGLGDDSFAGFAGDAGCQGGRAMTSCGAGATATRSTAAPAWTGCPAGRGRNSRRRTAPGRRAASRRTSGRVPWQGRRRVRRRSCTG